MSRFYTLQNVLILETDFSVTVFILFHKNVAEVMECRPTPRPPPLSNKPTRHLNLSRGQGF